MNNHKLTEEDFIRIIEGKRNGKFKKYRYRGIDPNNEKKVRIECTFHEETFSQNIQSFQSGSIGCKQCYLDKMESHRKPISFYQDLLDKQYPKGTYIILRREKVGKYFWFITKCFKHGGKEFPWRQSRIPKNTACLECRGEKITKGKTKDLSGLQDDLNRVYGFIGKTSKPKIEYLPEQDYKAPKDQKIFRCNLHDNKQYPQIPSNAKKGHYGCPDCISDINNKNKKNKTTYSEFLKKGREIHHNLYEYPLTKEVDYKNGYTKINVWCKRCEKRFEIDYAHHIVRAQGCPHHGKKESKGEKTLKYIFDDLKLKYEREFSFEESIYRYDFFLEKHNLLIEYDGIQHFKPTERGGQEEYNRCLKNDPIKNNLAKSKNVSLVRISYEITKEEEIKAIVVEAINRAKSNEVLFLRYGKAYEEFDRLQR